MRNSLNSTPIKLSCACLALCHTIEKTWILVKTGLLFPVFATLTRNDPWARITGQNIFFYICNIFNILFATYLMDSPGRRSERAVVADAAVVLLHAVVVVRSIVRNLDTSVLMNCGCLSHHFQPRLLCSLRRWPCTHHPLLFASQAHNLTHNSKLK